MRDLCGLEEIGRRISLLIGENHVSLLHLGQGLLNPSLLFESHCFVCGVPVNESLRVLEDLREEERHELVALLIESAGELGHAYGGFAGLPEDHPAVVLLHKIGKALKGHTNG
jgi:hypothetical protein